MMSFTIFGRFKEEDVDERQGQSPSCMLERLFHVFYYILLYFRHFIPLV